MSNTIRAVNWNKPTSDYVLTFWEQNLKQFWIDTEFVPSKDVKVWNKLSEAEKEAYKKALAGLTMLDTEQGGEGMPLILLHVNDLQKKAVLSFMSAMEEIHAKSYSTIFTTLAEQSEIDELFDWVEENKYLQYKGKRISEYYRKLFSPNASRKDVYMAMVASVFLESFLFYSGFFYPLYLAGQGKMVASGEIINLIIRDEAIHGLYVGLLAQEIYRNELTDEERAKVDAEVHQLLDDLMTNEDLYSEEIYADIQMDSEVKRFLRFNANNALMNLGRETYYDVEEVNPIVLNGLSTQTKTFDFFSNKGNGYQKGKVAPITDATFAFVNKKLSEVEDDI